MQIMMRLCQYLTTIGVGSGMSLQTVAELDSHAKTQYDAVDIHRSELHFGNFGKDIRQCHLKTGICFKNPKKHCEGGPRCGVP